MKTIKTYGKHKVRRVPPKLFESEFESIHNDPFESYPISPHIDMKDQDIIMDSNQNQTLFKENHIIKTKSPENTSKLNKEIEIDTVKPIKKKASKKQALKQKNPITLDNSNENQCDHEENDIKTSSTLNQNKSIAFVDVFIRSNSISSQHSPISNIKIDSKIETNIEKKKLTLTKEISLSNDIPYSNEISFSNDIFQCEIKPTLKRVMKMQAPDKSPSKHFKESHIMESPERNLFSLIIDEHSINHSHIPYVQPIKHKITYGNARSYLSQDSSGEYKSHASRNKEEGLDSSCDEQEPTVKGVYHMRNDGAAKRFSDEMMYLLDGMKRTQPLSIQQTNHFEFSKKCCHSEFIKKIKTFDYMPMFFGLLVNHSDIIVNAVSLFSLWCLCKEPFNLDYISSQPEVYISLSFSFNQPDPFLGHVIKNKFQKRLMDDIKCVLYGLIQEKNQSHLIHNENNENSDVELFYIKQMCIEILEKCCHINPISIKSISIESLNPIILYFKDILNKPTKNNQIQTCLSLFEQLTQSSIEFITMLSNSLMDILCDLVLETPKRFPKVLNILVNLTHHQIIVDRHSQHFSMTFFNELVLDICNSNESMAFDDKLLSIGILLNLVQTMKCIEPIIKSSHHLVLLFHNFVESNECDVNESKLVFFYVCMILSNIFMRSNCIPDTITKNDIQAIWNVLNEFQEFGKDVVLKDFGGVCEGDKKVLGIIHELKLYLESVS